MNKKRNNKHFKKVLDEQPYNTVDLKKMLVQKLDITYVKIQRYYKGDITNMEAISLMKIADFLNQEFHDGEKKYSLNSFYEE